jgi:hypothetical protein
VEGRNEKEGAGERKGKRKRESSFLSYKGTNPIIRAHLQVLNKM